MKGRYFLYIAAFVTIKAGVQLSGFDDGSGTMITIFGAIMLAGAIYLSYRAKQKAKAAQAPKA
jgi:threonine/homoserine/homoserine lactone efflux protein